MKYIYIPIYARNVYFTPPSEEEYKKLIKRAKNEKVLKWIKSNLRNWILNKQELPLLPERFVDNPNTPQWVKDKFGTEEIYLAQTGHIHNILGERASAIIDYLNTLSSNVNNMSVEEAAKQTRRYLDKEEKKLQEEKELDEKNNTKTIHAYPDGFRWIENFGEKTLIREGELMQNCLKEKEHQWFEQVSDKKIKIFSLRDNKNEPHISIEFNLSDRNIEQIKGKQNDAVPERYMPYLLDFLNKNYIQFVSITKTELELNKIVRVSGIYYDLDNFNLDSLEGTTVKDSLNLKGMKIDRLPDDLTIKGNLNISSTNIKELPKNLVVDGTLYLKNSQVSKIPSDTKVKELYLWNTKARLPNKFTLNYLELNHYESPTLPKNLTVKDQLNIRNSKLKELPSGLKVGNLLIDGCEYINTLPKDLVVTGDVQLSGSNVKYIPDGIKIKGHIFAKKGISFPPSLKNKVLIYK